MRAKPVLIVFFCRDLAYDPALLQRYKKALDSAVKIATVHNVSPIKGTTVIFCNLGKSTEFTCVTARGLGDQKSVGGVTGLCSAKRCFRWPKQGCFWV